jgi:SAM-dependent methyltransferase
MKIRDSDMPDQATWGGFFDPPLVLRRLEFSPADEAVDFGCGYGIFSIAAATLSSGVVHALDIEPAMVATTTARARSLGLSNVRAAQRDFVAEGTGLPDRSVTYAMLFNILHAEDADGLLREAFRVLRPGGTLAIIHWIHDASTPRGPDLSIRPRPEQCAAWAREVGFLPQPAIALSPYHYGLIAHKPAAGTASR